MSGDEERDYEDMDMTPVYATLHFYYDDPDSMRRMKECMDAPNVRSLLFDYDQWLRDQIKYHERPDEAGLQAARDMLWKIADENGIDIWEE